MDTTKSADVEDAARRLAGRIHRTPVMTSRTLDELAGCKLFFKCENLQRGGSFKIRGALNAALQTPGSEPLVTHSSGNHGAALALAGRELNRAVTVVVPEAAPAIKLANIERYGATVVLCGPTIVDREAAVAKVLAAGGVYISPYNHHQVIAGQGTLALELLAQCIEKAQCNELESLWLPVGGGGMASGCVAAVGEQVRVFGAEPLLADDAFESLSTGKLVGARPPQTIADGLRGALGDITFGMLSHYDLQIQRVDEQEIVDAQRLLMQCLKLVVEPSGAVAFAALLAHQRSQAAGKSDLKRATPTNAEHCVGVVISGGNVELALG